MHFETQCLQCKQNQINEGYKQTKAETSPGRERGPLLPTHHPVCSAGLGFGLALPMPLWKGVHSLVYTFLGQSLPLSPYKAWMWKPENPSHESSFCLPRWREGSLWLLNMGLAGCLPWGGLSLLPPLHTRAHASPSPHPQYCLPG